MEERSTSEPIGRSRFITHGHGNEDPRLSRPTNRRWAPLALSTDRATRRPLYRGVRGTGAGSQYTPWERPDQLFGTANSLGVTLELDRACCASALRTGLTNGLQSSHLLFVNMEPATLAEPIPGELERLLRQALESHHVVIEVTERAITSSPAGLLKNLERVKALGCGVALDDVGADSRSLALMPFLEPDIIKLDLSLIQQRPGAAVGAIASAVEAEVERNGAQVVAEGIETPQHLDTAVAIGATLGQGWLFGKPAALTAPTPASRPIVLRSSDKAKRSATPFQVLSQHRPVRNGTKRVLLMMSRQLEDQAMTFGEAPVVLATLQEHRFFTPATKQRYEQLARRGALIAVLGMGMDPFPARGVRGAALDADDPLRGEWVVAVVGPHFAGAFAARDEGDYADDMERRFTFSVTYERDLVIEIGQSILGRLQV